MLPLSHKGLHTQQAKPKSSQPARIWQYSSSHCGQQAYIPYKSRRVCTLWQLKPEELRSTFDLSRSPPASSCLRVQWSRPRITREWARNARAHDSTYLTFPAVQTPISGALITENLKGHKFEARSSAKFHIHISSVTAVKFI